MVHAYGYKSCTTVVKALNFLKENGYDYDFFDFVRNKIDKKVLLDLIDRGHLDIDAYFNSNGKIYKEENLKDKVPHLSYDEKIDLLLSDGKLIKRPILDFGDAVYVGFNKETIAAIESRKK